MKIPTLVVLLLSLLWSATARAQFSFRGIGGLETAPVVSSARGVSADGAVFASSVLVSGSFRAARWTGGGGFTLLGDLPGGTIIGISNGISANGQVIVGSSGSANGTEAFRWSAATGMIGLGDLPGEGVFSSMARAASADGGVIVGFTQRTENGVSHYRAFRWAGGAMASLGTLGGTEDFSVAVDVSADGTRIVGDSVSDRGREVFLWTAGGGMVGLGDLAGGGFSSSATAITADGRVVVGSSHSARGFEAFRWMAETGMVALGALPGPSFSSVANDVSNDGNVVVGLGSGAGDAGDGVAFVWFPATGMLDLREYLMAHGVSAVSGWQLSEAMAVSADGRTIVGHGINPAGSIEGWVATIEIDTSTPPPPPPPPPPADVAETFGPNAFSVTAGTRGSGGLSELQTSNNAYVTLSSRERATMQMTVDGRAARDAAGVLDFVVEAAAQGSTTRQEVALFDFEAGAWVALDSRNASSGDAVTTVRVTSNAGRFIQAGTQTVRTRLTWFPSAKKNKSTTVKIDRVSWTRTP